MHQLQEQGIWCRIPLSGEMSVNISSRCLQWKLGLASARHTGDFSNEKAQGDTDDQLQSYGLGKVERHAEWSLTRLK